MTVFARVLARLAEHIDGGEEFSPSTLGYRALADELSDEALLNELHWDNKAGVYADYGLHTDAVTLVRPPMPPNAHPNEPPVSASQDFTPV